MAKFKHKKHGHIIDVDETHAENVIRRQNVYEEIVEASPTEEKASPELKHKGFGKYVITKDGEEISEKYDSKEEALNAMQEM